MKKIELSLAACRILRPVYLDPFMMAQANMANKILSRQKKKNG